MESLDTAQTRKVKEDINQVCTAVVVQSADE
jgi:hypothetical protein